jgi:hypothetical protein
MLFSPSDVIPLRSTLYTSQGRSRTLPLGQFVQNINLYSFDNIQFYYLYGVYFHGTV